MCTVYHEPATSCLWRRDQFRQVCFHSPAQDVTVCDFQCNLPYNLVLYPVSEFEIVTPTVYINYCCLLQVSRKGNIILEQFNSFMQPSTFRVMLKCGPYIREHSFARGSQPINLVSTVPDFFITVPCTLILLYTSMLGIFYYYSLLYSLINQFCML